jgi:hypothetical protein
MGTGRSIEEDCGGDGQVWITEKAKEIFNQAIKIAMIANSLVIEISQTGELKVIGRAWGLMEIAEAMARSRMTEQAGETFNRVFKMIEEIEIEIEFRMALQKGGSRQIRQVQALIEIAKAWPGPE